MKKDIGIFLSSKNYNLKLNSDGYLTIQESKDKFYKTPDFTLSEGAVKKLTEDGYISVCGKTYGFSGIDEDYISESDIMVQKVYIEECTEPKHIYVSLEEVNSINSEIRAKNLEVSNIIETKNITIEDKNKTASELANIGLNYMNRNSDLIKKLNKLECDNFRMSAIESKYDNLKIMSIVVSLITIVGFVVSKL